MDTAESSQPVYAFFEKMSGKSSVTPTEPLPSPTKRSRIIALKVPRHFLIRDGDVDNTEQSISATSTHQTARNSSEIKAPLPIPSTPERIKVRIKVPNLKPLSMNKDDSSAGKVSAGASLDTRTKKRKTYTTMQKRKSNVLRLILPKPVSTQPSTSQCTEFSVEDIQQREPPMNPEAVQKHIFTNPKLCLDYVLESIPVIPPTTPCQKSDIEASLVPDDRNSEATTSCGSSHEHPTPILQTETVLPNISPTQHSTAMTTKHSLLVSCDSFVKSQAERPNTAGSTTSEPAIETAKPDDQTHEPVLPRVEAVETCSVPLAESSSPTTRPRQESSHSVDLIRQPPSVSSPKDNQIEDNSSHSRNGDPADSIALLYALNRDLALLHRQHLFYEQQKRFHEELDDDSPSLEEHFKSEIGNTKLAYKSAKVGRDDVSSRCRLLVNGNETLTSLLDQVEAWHAGSELNIPTTMSEIQNGIEESCVELFKRERELATLTARMKYIKSQLENPADNFSPAMRVFWEEEMQKTMQTRAETEQLCVLVRQQCGVMAKKNLMMKTFVDKLVNLDLGCHSRTGMS